MKRVKGRYLLVILIFLAISLMSGCITANNTKPNIILIVIDDLGWRDAGFMGSTFYETPNMDRLAAEGMVFTNAYANAPNCAPSRASIMTGQYTPRHEIYTVNSSERGESRLRKLIPVKNTTTLSRNKITIADVLKNAGYICASMGKWHLGDDPESGPLSQGFHLNIAGNKTGHPKSYFSPYKNNNLSDGPVGEYLTDRLSQEAVTFIKDNRNNPFFLYLPYYSVHTPLQAKPEIVGKYKNKKSDSHHNNAIYAAMIESVDSGIGKILVGLDQMELANNTLVILFSDNGGVRRITSMSPLRGGKGMLYEGGLRVPLVMRWPGHIKEGTKSITPVMGLDLFPTFLQAAGVNIPDQVILDGVSLLPVFEGKEFTIERALFWHFPAYLEGKAEGARDPHFRTRPGGVIQQGGWKLIEYFEDSSRELYNLRSDIGEKNNLIDSEKEKADELYQQLRQWRHSIDAPVPIEINPNYNP